MTRASPLPRAHARYDVRLSAEVTVGTRSFTAVTRNVSGGGCCIESAYALPEGGNVDLALFVVIDGVEDERMPPLFLRGHVQWCTESEAGDRRHVSGLRFEGASAAQTAWLERFLKTVGTPTA